MLAQAFLSRDNAARTSTGSLFVPRNSAPPSPPRAAPTMPKTLATTLACLCLAARAARLVPSAGNTPKPNLVKRSVPRTRSSATDSSTMRDFLEQAVREQGRAPRAKKAGNLAFADDTWAVLDDDVPLDPLAELSDARIDETLSTDTTAAHAATSPRAWAVSSPITFEYRVVEAPNLLDPRNDALVVGHLPPLSAERELALDRPQRRLIVIDETVDDLYGEKVRARFAARGVEHEVLRLPLVEEEKDMEAVLKVCAAMKRFNVDRRDEPVLAIGGGVALDVVGLRVHALPAQDAVHPRADDDALVRRRVGRRQERRQLYGLQGASSPRRARALFHPPPSAPRAARARARARARRLDGARSRLARSPRRLSSAPRLLDSPSEPTRRVRSARRRAARLGVPAHRGAPRGRVGRRRDGEDGDHEEPRALRAARGARAAARRRALPARGRARHGAVRRAAALDQHDARGARAEPVGEVARPARRLRAHDRPGARIRALGTAHELTHGESVAVDMAFMACLSNVAGLIDAPTRDRILAMLRGCGVPVCSPIVDRDFVRHAMSERRKQSMGLRLPLPVGLGKGRSFTTSTRSCSWALDLWTALAR